MCCTLEHPHGTYISKNPHKGYLDFTPKTYGAWFTRLFQRLELTEKIAELADESFHLFGTALKVYTNQEIYKFFHDMHHGAHQIETGLHAICFLGDVNRMCSGQFFEYKGKGKEHIHYLKTAARIIHTISHFFASAHLLHKLKIIQIDRLVPLIQYQSALSALGFGLWAISLLWDRFIPGKKNKHFKTDLGIHLAGSVFELLNHLENETYKISAIAGMIHASCAIQRLMPPDREPVSLRK